jgi:hypothetical protein
MGDLLFIIRGTHFRAFVWTAFVPNGILGINVLIR